MISILEFNHTEAREFLLKEESYFNFDLPPYFVFKNLLEDLSQEFDGNTIEDFYRNHHPTSGNPQRPFPSELEGVNYTLLNNKDGKYAWRPFQLIHPALYVALVHKITEENNWALTLDRFQEFQSNPKIKCKSIPLESEDNLSDKATAVSNWWQEIEQESLVLSLKFSYMMQTDISDCYGSIYTHSIPWALHTKPFAKTHRSYIYVGNAIDKYVRDMNNGQTNGIPQGSVLMDFIAEMILGYADLKLSELIEESSIEDYEIIRYRDDYRFFTNNPQDAEKITKFLTEILIGLGMRLNTDKTASSSNIIKDAIKPDKLYWNTAKTTAKSIQNHLLLIHGLSAKYPNSGSLRKALDKFYHRIKNLNSTVENIHVLISILIDIAFKNPRTYPSACAILSKLLSLIEDENERDELLNQIRSKFDKIPNTGHIKIWLQRLTLKIDADIEYDEILCQKVNDSSINLWNSDWLNDDINEIIDNATLVDESIIDEINTVIELVEIALFDY